MIHPCRATRFPIFRVHEQSGRNIAPTEYSRHQPSSHLMTNALSAIACTASSKRLLKKRSIRLIVKNRSTAMLHGDCSKYHPSKIQTPHMSVMRIPDMCGVPLGDSFDRREYLVYWKFHPMHFATDGPQYTPATLVIGMNIYPFAIDICSRNTI